MPFARPTLTDLIDRIQADLVSRLALGGAVLRRSVIGVLARVEAGAAHQQHGHLDYLGRQILPDTADTGFLERHAGLFGLARLAATYATGTLTCTGTDGATILTGALFQRADGVQVAATADATIASGTAPVAVQALSAGVEGNTDVGVLLTSVSPIAGVAASAAVASGGVIGGLAAESDEGLRARVLDRMRQPPHGGSEADYHTWALETPGVTRAWVYPLELGPGAVTVRFVRDDDVGGAIPDAGEVAAVQAYIETRRPVTATVTVVAPVAAPLAITLAVTPNTAVVQAAVLGELADFFRRDAAPGSTTRRSQLELAIGIAVGVTDFSVAAPAADVTHATGQIATLGAVTFT